MFDGEDVNLLPRPIATLLRYERDLLVSYLRHREDARQIDALDVRVGGRHAPN